MEVSNIRMTPTSLSSVREEERGPLLSFMYLMHPFAPAPCQESGADDHPTMGLATSWRSLRQRFRCWSSRCAAILFMFSGATGAVVGSGRGEAATAPTYGLAQAVLELMETLPPELFHIRKNNEMK